MRIKKWPAWFKMNEGLFHKTSPEGKALFKDFHLWSWKKNMKFWAGLFESQLTLIQGQKKFKV